MGMGRDAKLMGKRITKDPGACMTGAIPRTALNWQAWFRGALSFWNRDEPLPREEVAPGGRPQSPPLSIGVFTVGDPLGIHRPGSCPFTLALLQFPTALPRA